MSEEALQILLPDARRFYTAPGNRPYLAEFAQAFDARITVVTPPAKVEILRLSDLAKAVCRPGSGDGPIAKVGAAERAKEIRDYVRGRLIGRHAVTARMVAERFEDYGLSRPTIASHIAAARDQLVREGRTVTRSTAGEYRLSDD